ncbi:MAG: hypothetical protein R2867_45965 [Caldilineaceae bacterium]
MITTIWGGIAPRVRSIQDDSGVRCAHDWGLILMLLAVPSPTDAAGPSLCLARFASMLTAAAGLSVLEFHTNNIDVKGCGRNRLPLTSAAFLLGGLGLTGFTSAGFTGHWVALQADRGSRLAPGGFRAAGFCWRHLGLCASDPYPLWPPLVQPHARPRTKLPSVLMALLLLFLTVGLAVSRNCLMPCPVCLGCLWWLDPLYFHDAHNLIDSDR